MMDRYAAEGGNAGMRKRASYAAVYSLVALTLIAVGFLGFGGLVNKEIQTSTRNRFETYASQQKSYISTVLESRFSILRSFAEFLGEELPGDSGRFAHLSAALCESVDFDHVLFIDREGHYLVDTGDSGQGGYTAGRAALLDSEASISPPFRAFYQQDELCMLLSVPVRDAQGEVIGLLCGSYTAQRFGSLLLQDTYRDASYSLLTDASGRLLFSASKDALFIPDPADGGERSIVPSPTFFDDAYAQTIRDSMARREDNYYTFSHSGVDYVLVQTPLDQNGWLLFCMMPTQALVSDYARITRLRHLQIVVIMLIIGLCSFALIMQLMRERRALRRSNSELSVRASTDSMTGLLNQATTRRIIETALSGPGLASALLLVVDVDNLKCINDTHGHPMGDRAILMLAEQIRALFPDADAIGRVGGDEFMVFLRDSGGRAHAQAQLETLCRQLAQRADGEQVPLRCSIGGAFALPGEDYISLYGRADAALYHVKRNGRDGFAFQEDIG